MHLRNILVLDTGLQQLTSCTPTTDPSRRIVLLSSFRGTHGVAKPREQENGQRFEVGRMSGALEDSFDSTCL